MSLTLDYNNDDKILYSDNTLVRQTKDNCFYLSIRVTTRGATINRYCVPGRIDDYTFDWVPGGCGIGDRVTFFTDTNKSLEQALKQVKRDLKKKHVKELIEAANKKFTRSYLVNLLDGLR